MPGALVVCCWHRSSNKTPRLVADISEPVRWKWKKKNVGLSSIVKTKFASTSSCAIPKCQSCELAWTQQRSRKVKKVQSNLDSEGAISCNGLEVGDFVSTDQFVCRTPGRLSSGYTAAEMT